MRAVQRREEALELFISYWGSVTNKELACLVGVHSSTISRWKREGNWADRLNQAEFLYQTQPVPWMEKAVALKYSAEVLLARTQESGDRSWKIEFGDSLAKFGSTMKESEMLGGSYLVLAGMALENLFKAILVLQNPALVNGCKACLKEEIRTHDLLRLSGKIRIDLSDAEFDARAFLEKLATYVTWEGRYPVPLKADDYRLSRYDPDKDSARLLWVWKRAEQRLKEILFKEGRGVFDIMPRLNWPPP
jgi:hypothetical protein